MQYIISNYSGKDRYNHVQPGKIRATGTNQTIGILTDMILKSQPK